MKLRIDNIRHALAFELVFFVLAIVSMSLLIYEMAGDLNEQEVARIVAIDAWIAFLFLLDFLVGFLAAQNSRRYLKENWYLLLASLTFQDHPLRLLRVLRVLRIIRMATVLSKNEHIHDDLPNWLRKMMQRLPHR